MSEGLSTLNIDKTKTPVKLFGAKNTNSYEILSHKNATAGLLLNQAGMSSTSKTSSIPQFLQSIEDKQKYQKALPPLTNVL